MDCFKEQHRIHENHITDFCGFFVCPNLPVDSFSIAFSGRIDKKTNDIVHWRKIARIGERDESIL